jgi:hypothetical protein
MPGTNVSSWPTGTSSISTLRILGCKLTPRCAKNRFLRGRDLHERLASGGYPEPIFHSVFIQFFVAGLEGFEKK